MQQATMPDGVMSTEISDLGGVSLASLATATEDPEVTSLIGRIAPNLPDADRAQAFFTSGI